MHLCKRVDGGFHGDVCVSASLFQESFYSTQCHVGPVVKGTAVGPEMCPAGESPGDWGTRVQEDGFAVTFGRAVCVCVYWCTVWLLAYRHRLQSNQLLPQSQVCSVCSVYCVCSVFMSIVHLYVCVVCVCMCVRVCVYVCMCLLRVLLCLMSYLHTQCVASSPVDTKAMVTLSADNEKLKQQVTTLNMDLERAKQQLTSSSQELVSLRAKVQSACPSPLLPLLPSVPPA